MPATERDRRPAAAEWGRGRRLAVSLVVALHLLAVCTPPFAFQTSPVRGVGSPLAEAAMSWFRPYIELFYLNHGYAFFAPDPGPSHLLRAHLEFDDGRPPREVVLPDLGRHWPRLLYHRYFMLAEHLHAGFVPPDPPPEVADDPPQRAVWRQARQLYQARRGAIERRLLERYGAARVTLRRVEHRLLDPYEFGTLGKRPDDPDTYVDLSEEAPPGDGS